MDNNQNMNQNEQQNQTLPPSQQQYQVTQPQPTYQTQQTYEQPQPTYQTQQTYEQPQQNYQTQQNYQQYQQNQYQQTYQNMGPLLKTDRSLVKFILLSIITCGIYAIIFYSKIGEDINRVASGRDGKKTTHYCLAAFIFTPLTCGIYAFYWWHTISDRIGEEARARGIYTDFSATTFWLWQLVGAVLCGIGPFIYIHKLCKVMNDINNNYNQFGR